jgi:hypothetical protein
MLVDKDTRANEETYELLTWSTGKKQKEHLTEREFILCLQFKRTEIYQFTWISKQKIDLPLKLSPHQHGSAFHICIRPRSTKRRKRTGRFTITTSPDQI